MIQDIAPHEYHIGYEYKRDAHEDDFAVVIREGKVLVNTFTLDGTGIRMILVKNPAGCNQALAYLDTVNVDTAVMATSGFSLDYGFTSGSYTDCEIKRAVIHRARRTIMLVDSSKIGRSLPTTFANLADISALVTDVRPSDDIVAACKEAGVQLVY